jgi:hypothetical protein
MSTYQTRHVGLAAFLHFVGVTHIATTRDEKTGRFAFTFEDQPAGRCRELGDHFFSSEGAAVADARTLLECLRELKATMIHADRNGGLWQSDTTKEDK